MDNYSFDSRMLLKILLDPATYLINRQPMYLNKESCSLIKLNIIKVVKDNLLESALNGYYVKSNCIYDAVKWFDGTSRNEKTTSSIKTIIKYVTKMCLLDCMFFKTTKSSHSIDDYNYNFIRVLPCIQNEPNKFTKYTGEFDGKDTSSLFLIADYKDIDKIFTRLKVNDKLWKYSTIGFIFTEFPTVVSLCNRAQVDNIISEFESDTVIDYLMKVLYLMMVYDFYGVIVSDFDTDSVIKEVISIEQKIYN